MKQLTKILFLFYILIVAENLSAQQLPLYSQYMWNDYVLNPAFTGSVDFSPVRFTYRKQWVGFNGSPVTMTLGGQTAIKNKIGLGGLIFNDATGGAITQSGVMLNYAYRVQLNTNSILSFGVSGLFNQYTFDNNKVDALVPNDAALQGGKQTSFAPDVSFGMMFQLNQKLKTGLAVNQLIQSRLNKLNNVTLGNKLIRHYNAYASYNFVLNKKFELEPSLLLKATEVTPIQADINAKLLYKKLFWIGASFRNNDAIVAMLGLNYENLFIGYSYDATLSEMGKYSSGSHEIVVGYNFMKKKLVDDRDKDGVADKDDGCPDLRGPKENKGCPWGDKDKDGVTDNIDKCPDVFGTAKNSGCPEEIDKAKDSDGDGVPDIADSCPNTKGDKSNRGCPIVTDKQKEIVSNAISNLEFENNSSVIEQSSLIGLDMLAILLSEKDDWKLKIAGHTDNVGTSEFNMQLSKARAESVRDYLISKGLKASRFIIEYYGETKPIDTNDTEEGRQKNRRVEMVFIFE